MIDLTKLNEHIALLRQYSTLQDSERTKLLSELGKVKLLTPEFANTKTAKNEGRGYLSFIMHFAPASLSGFNVCPKASEGCKAACLNTAGRGIYENIQLSRIRKTLFWVKAREAFLTQLFREIKNGNTKAKANGLKLAIRLNGTSDIPWEYIKLNGKSAFETFPDVQFYDYTKVTVRLPKLKELGLTNYHVTFSRSETNDAECLQALALGYNVAVVFDETPETWQGHRVINGDEHDLRFLDAGQSVVIGLYAKGKAKKDASGFVVQTCPSEERKAA